MNLAGIDLNLMLVFDAVMNERHVTRAGDKIGMSQPAMSNALNRLRHHLKDELFLRGHDGMRPTPRALELAGPIRGALSSLEAALDPVQFDPATSSRTFSVGTNDYCVAILIPEIAARLEQEAPGINIRLVSSAGQTFEMLDTQDIDFGISSFGEIPERFGSEILLEDSYVLTMREGHPLAEGKLSLEAYISARHMLVSPRGETSGFVDHALAQRGRSRQVAMVVNNFSSAPAILAKSDLILTMPKRSVETFAPLYSLVMRPAPFSGPQEYSTATLVWHERLAHHPAHIWFRDFLIGVAQDFHTTA